MYAEHFSNCGYLLQVELAIDLGNQKIPALYRARKAMKIVTPLQVPNRLLLPSAF